MPLKWTPVYEITPKIAKALMRIEAVKQAIQDLPMTPKMLHSLRESAQISSVHYSTRIEGNRLTEEQVERVIKKQEHFVGRERDEEEIRGYYAALSYLERMVEKKGSATELFIQTLHALTMNEKKGPSIYRDGQNVIRDSANGLIVYTESDSKIGKCQGGALILGQAKPAPKQLNLTSLAMQADPKSSGCPTPAEPIFQSRAVYMPPEAKDVPALMQALVHWLQEQEGILPCPLIAAMAHYQFATIHPYYDGNGRTARLLTTWILHRGGYDLKGLYSLEEYYARDLQGYYDAISIGPSHNYYMGRETADITKWIEYFCEGMADSFEKVRALAQAAAQSGERDQSTLLRELDPKQRRVLELFQKQKIITARNIGALFGFKQRSSAHLCQQWVEVGFLVVIDASKKGRKYELASRWVPLIQC